MQTVLQSTKKRKKSYFDMVWPRPCCLAQISHSNVVLGELFISILKFGCNVGERERSALTLRFGM